ncbi:MAG: hypothetical protein GQ534_01100, partial [Candidatus Delongbacteria bacterium]|nr:hypothetical protein [Candidatus Delongbacteria bacterium]
MRIYKVNIKNLQEIITGIKMRNAIQALIILIILSISFSALIAQDAKVPVGVNGATKAASLKQQVEAGTITPEAAMQQAEALNG